MLLHHARNHESDNLALQSLKLAPLTPFSLNNLGFAMERKVKLPCTFLFFFSSRRRHTRSLCDWSSYVCSSDLTVRLRAAAQRPLPSMMIATARATSGSPCSAVGSASVPDTEVRPP